MTVEPFKSQRRKALGDLDVVAVGSTAHIHAEPTTGEEWVDTTRLCVAPYWHPRPPFTDECGACGGAGEIVGVGVVVTCLTCVNRRRW